MQITKSMKRRLTRKNHNARIREASTPKPLSIQEIQAKIAKTKAEEIIRQFNALAPVV